MQRTTFNVFKFKQVMKESSQKFSASKTIFDKFRKFEEFNKKQKLRLKEFS